MDVLTEIERQDPIWRKIEEHLEERKQRFIRILVKANDESVRGKIQELDYLLSPPTIVVHGK
jgi:hypothetical protein